MTHAVEAVGRDDRVGLGQGREGGCGGGGGVGEAQRWRGFRRRLGQRDVGHQVELEEAKTEEKCKRLLCRLMDVCSLQKPVPPPCPFTPCSL